MARLAFLTRDFDAAKHYASKAKVIADQGQVSLRLRVSAMLIGALIRIEMAERSGDGILESDFRTLAIAGNEAEIVSAVSRECGWTPMGAIAKFLQIRVDFFRYRHHSGLPESDKFDVSKNLFELNGSISSMKECSDCSFAGPMNLLREALEQE